MTPFSGSMPQQRNRRNVVLSGYAKKVRARKIEWFYDERDALPGSSTKGNRDDKILRSRERLHSFLQSINFADASASLSTPRACFGVR
jgi:hypothetical protein